MDRFFKMAGIMAVIFFVAFVAIAAQKLEVAWDKRGPIDVIPSSDYVHARVMAASTAESITVPTGYNYVIFGCEDGSGNATSFYADFHGTTAAQPSADITDGTGPELNPYARYLGGITTISVICPAACIVTAAFYQDSF